MTKLLKVSLLAFLPALSTAYGQANPAIVAPAAPLGFQLPEVGGTLSYALTASEAVNVGYNATNATTEYTSFSGDLAYLNRSKTHPFSAVYSGGFFVGSGEPSSVFQSLSASQVLVDGRWTFVASDSISYLPETANSGLSGIPGNGDIGVTATQVGTNATQGILTYVDARISNTTGGSVQRAFTGKTSLTGFGSFGILRFLGNSSLPGLSSNSYSAGAALTHRLDARDSISGNYSYSSGYYPGDATSYNSNTATVEYNRQLTRKLTFDGSVGPQWTTVSNGAPAVNSLNVAANVSLLYSAHSASYVLSYSRGTNTGSGVLTGAESDNVTLSASKRLSRTLSGSASLGYSRTQSLAVLDNSPFHSNTLVASGQINRYFGRDFSAFASYIVQRQSLNGVAATSNIFNGFSQIIAVGVTYSPGIINLGRR